MENIKDMINRRFRYAIIGFVMAVSAPLIWIVIRLIFFANPEQSIWTQIFSDITRDAERLALYSYMGFGTAVTMASLGYFIGRVLVSLAGRSLVTMVLAAATRIRPSPEPRS